MSVKFKVPIEVDGKVSAEYLDLSTTTTRVVDAGEIAWNSIDGTFDIGLLNGVTLQAGQEMHFYGKATEAISNGNAVMFAGVQGDHILIAKADAATINANPEYFMGVATQDFTTNQFGYVTAFGNVRGLNTLSYTLGDVLYFDSTSATDGLLTATEPSAPNAKIIVAAVVRVHATQGILAVRPHTMPKLKDIQDVNVDTATTGEILQLQSTGVWENKTLSEAGIISGTGTTNYLSKFTGSTTLGNSLLFDNGTNVGIGTTSPTAKLNVETNTTPLRLNRTGGATALIGLDINGVNRGFIGATTTSAFESYSTAASPLLSILNTGNVGIGTTSPSYKLDISADNNRARLLGTTGYVLLDLQNNASSFYIGRERSTGGAIIAGSAAYSGVINLQGNYPLYLGTNGVIRTTITGDGNVGIGTTSPLAKLDIVTPPTGFNRGMKIGPQTGTDGDGTYIEFTASSTDGFGPQIGGIRTGAGGLGDLIIKTGGNLQTERFRVTNAGNVGIGTTTPSEKLDVNGTVNVGSGIILLGQNKIDGSSDNLKISADYGNVSGGSSIEFLTDGTEKVRIDLSGNVGIGTTSPTFTAGGGLQIVRSDYANVRVTGGASVGIDLLQSSDGTGYLRNRDNAQLRLGTNNVDVITITNTGNVGIGTTAPSIKLQVETSVNGSDGIWARNTNTGTSAFGSINCVSGVGAINLRAHSAAHSVWPSTSMINSASAFTGGMVIFQDGANPISLWTNGSERMRLTSTGNLGIGTSTIASSRLTISGGSLPTQDNGNTNALQFSGGVTGRRASSNTVGFIGTYLNTSSIEISAGLSGAGISMHGSSASSNANSLVLYTNSAESMRITSTGNVGIGTTAPGTKLDVVGTANTFASIGTTGASSGRALLFQDKKVTATKYNWLIGAQYNIDNAFEITPSTAIGGSTYSTPSVTILQSGNVGIGTSSPAQKLHVEGSAAVGTTGTEDILLLGRAISSGVSFQQAASLKLGRYQNAGGSYESYTRLDFALRDNSPSSNYNTNTTVMTLTNAGNVGIGTTSPSQKLTVGDGTGTGNQYVRVHSSSSDIYIGQSASTLFGIAANSSQLIVGDKTTFPLVIGTTSAQPFIFGTSSLERMRVAANGNVGIGTTSPNGKLQIQDTNGGIFFDGTGPTYNRFKSITSSASVGRDLLFSTQNSGTTPDLYITSTGNVGIGTTSPSEKLEVNGSIRLSDGNADGPQLKLASSGYSDWNLDNYNGSFRAYYGSSEYFRITDVGNVGIGTTNPSANLEVVGTSFSVSPFVRIKHDIGPVAMSFDLTCDLFSAAGILDVGDSSNTIFKRGSSESMRIDGDGYIGINTSAPNARFHLRETNQGQRAMTIQINEDPVFGCGLINFENNSGSNIGSIFYNGSSTSYNTSSDYRLKENVVKIDRALERLKLLKPVNFNFINKPGTVVDGFIAHEVQEVIPEAIVGVKDELDKYGKPKYQGIDHSKIVPLLTAALQEAIDKISQLEERIQKLENK